MLGLRHAAVLHERPAPKNLIDETEDKADDYAKNILIPEDKYKVTM